MADSMSNGENEGRFERSGERRERREREGFSPRREGRDFREGRDGQERIKLEAMEVAVDHNIEKAMKVLKRKLIKEGLFKELKSRRYFEKPSERRKRKVKESIKKIRKEEARSRKNSALL
jgi:small subunit ribosomal protein S21